VRDDRITKSTLSLRPEQRLTIGGCPFPARDQTGRFRGQRGPRGTARRVGRPISGRRRLAVTYAILDKSESIELAHVLAAEASWRYSVGTVEHVFGAMRGDTVQDRLLAELRAVYPEGLTGTQQADPVSA
jgi:hypothetical protein